MTESIKTLDQLALRPGGPEDWDEAEYPWEIEPRINKALGLTRGTDEIRLAVNDEVNRQKALLNTYRREQQRLADEQAYETRMGAIATQLAAAISSFATTGGDEEALRSSILNALRPLDERIQYLQMITGPNLLAGNRY